MLEAGWLASLVLAAAALSALAGMAWLALAMEVHWEQVHGEVPRSPRRVRALRILGTLGLVGSLALCLVADHASMAALVWVMALAGAVLIIAMTLAWRPGWLRLVPVGPLPTLPTLPSAG